MIDVFTMSLCLATEFCNLLNCSFWSTICAWNGIRLETVRSLNPMWYGLGDSIFPSVHLILVLHRTFETSRCKSWCHFSLYGSLHSCYYSKNVAHYLVIRVSAGNFPSTIFFETNQFCIVVLFDFVWVMFHSLFPLCSCINHRWLWVDGHCLRVTV